MVLNEIQLTNLVRVHIDIAYDMLEVKEDDDLTEPYTQLQLMEMYKEINDAAKLLMALIEAYE